MSCPSADRCRMVRIGSATVGVFHPPPLAIWFTELPQWPGGQERPSRWVAIHGCAGQGRFDFASSDGIAAEALDLGATLALAWETLVFLLVDDLTAGFALHRAVLRNEDGLLLLPGQSGAGKTRLSLWFRSQGFSFETDEFALLTLDSRNGDAISASCLPRPAILRNLTTGKGLVQVDDGRTNLVETPSGTDVRIKVGARTSLPKGPVPNMLAVFPCFRENVPLQLTVQSPAQTAFRLLGACINVRNLPRGGLAFASRLGQAIVAVTLTYGDTAQLSGTLDVLARQALAGAPNRKDLSALCEAFVAKSTRSRGEAEPAALHAPHSSRGDDSPLRPAPHNRHDDL